MTSNQNQYQYKYTTLNEFKSLAHLRKSNCSKALDFSMNFSADRNAKEMTQRYASIASILHNRSGSHRLKAINIGLGTTGTRSLARALCLECHVVSLHHTASCLTSFHGLAEQYAPQRWYFSDKAIDYLYLHEQALGELLTHYEFISDDPFAQMLPDLLPFVPHLEVLATLRDPITWARRRKQQHSKGVICQRWLWSHLEILHPFDFYGCLRAVGEHGRVRDALMTIESVDEQELARAFVWYNSVMFHLALANGVHLHPRCFWDGDTSKVKIKSGNSSMGQLVRGFSFCRALGTQPGRHHRLPKKLKTNRFIVKYNLTKSFINKHDSSHQGRISPGNDETLHWSSQAPLSSYLLLFLTLMLPLLLRVLSKKRYGLVK